MLGQNVIPRTIDPVISALPQAEVSQKLELLRQAMNQFADTLPSHEEMLRKYCASEFAAASPRARQS
jgi:tryptophan halogenase